MPARASVDGSRRSGLGPSPLQHATPPRPGSPRDSQAPHKTPSLLRELPENHTLRQLRANSLPQPPSPHLFISPLAQSTLNTRLAILVPRRLATEACNPPCPLFSNRPPSSSIQNLLEGGVPSRFSFTPPRSGNEGVSRGTEGNRRENRAGKPAYHCPFFLPRLHPSLGDRDHTVPARWRVVSMV